MITRVRADKLREALRSDKTVPVVSGQSGFLASFDHGPNVELSPTKSLGEEFAGAQLIALFVRLFRCERGEELLETRIIPKRIEHRIEPE